MSMSISLPFICGLVSSLWIDKRLPGHEALVICMGLGLVVEFLDYTAPSIKAFSYVTNFYILVEALLMLYQFSVWRNSNLHRPRYSLGIITCLIWFISIYVSGLENRNAFFIIFYSFLLIVVAINTVNDLLFKPALISKRYILIISLSYICYWTFSMLVELMIHYYDLFSIQFVANTFYIKSILNVLTNLIISYGLLCTPKKPKFLLSFS